ncbi:MAG TPA: SusD/RagB family nutrient-binding outer membrane lipoprotein, partial [Flavihumibacter sp.]|nr:SusD/RagB family nutrient-binding outer membrane lipoprotein [Flavihumibacter sp.]
MKTFITKSICSAALLAGALLVSCNKQSLSDLNINPNSTPNAEPAYLFTGAIVALPAFNYSVLGQGMQYYSTYKEVPAIGDKYYSFTGTIADFTGFYTNKLNRLLSIEPQVQGADDVNKLSMVRILKVYVYSQLTDIAGDIPYSEALAGKTNLTPKYDTQRDIYLDMFKELEQATAALDAAKASFGTADLLYKGDVAKWQKFGYSLMLRLGMRLTKVDETLAKTWVEKAINGGVMTSLSDAAKI